MSDETWQIAIIVICFFGYMAWTAWLDHRR
jgi:hypothetical protein